MSVCLHVFTMRVCVFMCVSECVHLFMWVCVFAFFECMSVYVSVCLHECVYMSMCTFTWVCMFTWVCACLYECLCVYVSVCLHECECVFTCLHACECVFTWVCVYMSVCLCECLWDCVSVYVSVWVHMGRCTCMKIRRQPAGVSRPYLHVSPEGWTWASRLPERTSVDMSPGVLWFLCGVEFNNLRNFKGKREPNWIAWLQQAPLASSPGSLPSVGSLSDFKNREPWKGEGEAVAAAWRKCLLEWMLRALETPGRCWNPRECGRDGGGSTEPQGPQQRTEAMEVVASEVSMYLWKHFSDFPVM